MKGKGAAKSDPEEKSRGGAKKEDKRKSNENAIDQE